MKKIILLLFLFIFSIQTKAAKYAIQFCQPVTENQAYLFAEKNDFKAISFLPYDNTLLIESRFVPTNTTICFLSKLKTYQNHIAFFKNEILIRATEKDIDIIQKIAQQEGWNLIKNEIIPFQYKLKDIATNEEDLVLWNKKLQEQLPLSLISINTVFTLDASMVDDPLYNRQWSIENVGSSFQGNGTPNADMNVDSAWTISTGNNTKIAILDSGVDTLHEDLMNNLLPGFDGYANDTSDTKGYPTPNFSSDGHGTACAGIAAAEGDNSLGVAGIAYTSQIIPIRVFYYKDYGSGIGVQPTTSTESLINGAGYAWRVANCDIISVSAGLNDLFIAVLGIDVSLVNAEMEAAFYQGRNGFGVPMFFSSGNDDINDVLWPADLPYTIAVGASSMCDERKNPNDCSSESWGSSYGNMLDIIAPGTRIASTDMTGSNGYSANGYTYTFNGTSAACPNAAGVGALILATNPNLHARDVKAILNSTATKVNGYNYDTTTVHGTWNEEVGHGRVDAFAAVKSAQTYQTTVSATQLPLNITLSIYPNPSNGAVLFENKGDKEIDLVIFNTLGQIIDSISLLPNQLLNRNYETGIYLVKDLDNKGQEAHTIIIY